MSRVKCRGAAGRILAVTGVAALVAACSSHSQPSRSSASIGRPSFSEDEYGVSTSPRVAGGSRIGKGGGHFKLGAPYKVAGRWYVPREEPGYDRVGIASWYGDDFHGRRTANGEVFDRYALSAAHPTLPLPSYAYVTNLENGRVVLVRVNDRGPYVNGRIIDLSHASASALGYVGRGHTRVRVTFAGLAPLNGDDRRERQFLAEQSSGARSAFRVAVQSRQPQSPRLPERPEQYATFERQQPISGWSPTSYRAAAAGRSSGTIGPNGPLRFEQAGAPVYGSQAMLADGDLRPAYGGGSGPSLVAGPRPAPRPIGAAGQGRAFVDLGSYADAAAAEQVRREFATLGSIEVAPTQDEYGRPAYRVRLGPLSYRDAGDAVAHVAARGVSGATVITR